MERYGTKYWMISNIGNIGPLDRDYRLPLSESGVTENYIQYKVPQCKKYIWSIVQKNCSLSKILLITVHCKVYRGNFNPAKNVPPSADYLIDLVQ